MVTFKEAQQAWAALNKAFKKQVKTNLFQEALQLAVDIADEYVFNTPPASGCDPMFEVAEYDSNGDFIGCVPASNDPIPDSPTSLPIPSVSIPPRKIYLDDFPVPPPEQPEDAPPPPKPKPPPAPPRRLPPLAPAPTGTVPTGTLPNKSIVVQIPVTNGAYGTLLHEPIKRSVVKVKTTQSYILPENFAIKQRERAARFLLWVIGKDDPEHAKELSGELGLEPAQRLEETGYVLMTTRKTPASPLKTVPIFGIDSINEVIDDYVGRSTTAFAQIGGLVPVVVNFIAPAEPKTQSELMLANFNTKLSSKSDDISKLVELINLLSDAVGVDEFPAKLPKRLIYPNAKGEEEVNSIAEVFAYVIKQIDKAVGFLPQKIKVLDTNPAKAGNQSVEVDIHSFADFARETLQYLIDTESDDDALTNIAVRILYECGAIHQAVVQGDAMLDAIVEHMDFKEKWEEIKVPFSFDPYAGQKGKKAGFDPNAKPLPLTEEELEKLLPDLLKETMVKIRILKNDQKRTMNDLLLEIMKESRAAAAAVTEPATGKRIEELVKACQAALQLQNAIARNNVRKGLAAGDMRTRKIPKPK